MPYYYKTANPSHFFTQENFLIQCLQAKRIMMIKSLSLVRHSDAIRSDGCHIGKGSAICANHESITTACCWKLPHHGIVLALWWSNWLLVALGHLTQTIKPDQIFCSVISSVLGLSKRDFCQSKMYYVLQISSELERGKLKPRTTTYHLSGLVQLDCLNV